MCNKKRSCKFVRTGICGTGGSLGTKRCCTTSKNTRSTALWSKSARRTQVGEERCADETWKGELSSETGREGKKQQGRQSRMVQGEREAIS